MKSVWYSSFTIYIYVPYVVPYFPLVYVHAIRFYFKKVVTPNCASHRTRDGGPRPLPYSAAPSRSRRLGLRGGAFSRRY